MKTTVVALIIGVLSAGIGFYVADTLAAPKPRAAITLDGKNVDLSKLNQCELSTLADLVLKASPK